MQRAEICDTPPIIDSAERFNLCVNGAFIIELYPGVHMAIVHLMLQIAVLELEIDVFGFLHANDSVWVHWKEYIQ